MGVPVWSNESANWQKGRTPASRSTHQLRGLLAAEQIGFRTHAGMPLSDDPDAAIRRAAERAGLPFCEVTSQIRAHARDTRLYFDFDDHFSAAGHRLFGESISGAVQNRVVGQAPC